MKRKHDVWGPIDSKTKSNPINVNANDLNVLTQLSPCKLEDLAVHPKKVEQVRDWLCNNVLTKNDRPTKILLITGPTGSGKTTTLTLLCQSLNIEITEWTNPFDLDHSEQRGPGQMEKFLDFISQSKYPSLMVSKSSNKSKIVLIEEYPNTVINNCDSFPEILECCIHNKTPTVFICTDTNSTNLDLSYKLFPQEILNRYCIEKISFNPCAVTLMKKALKRFENVKFGSQFQKPSQAAIEFIVDSSLGDIRTATLQYYFACLNDGIPKAVPTKRRKGQKSTKPTSRALIKDEKVGMFHSLGRILNPKTTQVDGKTKFVYDINTLMEEISIQPRTVLSFLQENYLKYFGNLADVSQASDILSYSQMLSEFWTESQDTLSYSLWLSVVGLMLCNRHKVTKWNQIVAPTKIQKRSSSSTSLDYIPCTELCYYDKINKTSKYHKYKKPKQ